jgi:hypothetical protein
MTHFKHLPAEDGGTICLQNICLTYQPTQWGHHHRDHKMNTNLKLQSTFPFTLPHC